MPTRSLVRGGAVAAGAVGADRPQLRLIVGARGRTRRGVSTPLTAILTQGPGQANIRSVSVTLPAILNARLEVVGDACTPAQFDAGDCEQARIGSAVAVTPLLREPLRGGVYLVRARPRGLPDLVVALRGQVDFDLVGRVMVPGGRLLRAAFGAVPDVPIRRFVLRLSAGRRGVLGAASDLCRTTATRASAAVLLAGQSGVGDHPAKAELDFIGQNGKVKHIDQRMKFQGCGKHRSARKL